MNPDSGVEASTPSASGLHVCTIIARNYLPAARVLASSFRAHNPGGVMSVLVTDDIYGEVRAAGEPFEVVHVHDLDEDRSALHHMAAIYEITEFATSLKPWLLEHLLDRGATAVLYLDPDIVVFDRLDELARAAEECGIALTPHARAPFPRDNKMTDEKAILAVGVYNLGFIGVGAELQTVPGLLEGAPEARIAQRHRQHALRRPTLGRFRPRHVRLPDRPRSPLQRRLLEPARAPRSCGPASDTRSKAGRSGSSISAGTRLRPATSCRATRWSDRGSSCRIIRIW